MTREEFESILEEAYIEGYNTAIEDIQEDILDEEAYDLEGEYKYYTETLSKGDKDEIGISMKRFDDSMKDIPDKLKKKMRSNYLRKNVAIYAHDRNRAIGRDLKYAAKDYNTPYLQQVASGKYNAAHRMEKSENRYSNKVEKDKDKLAAYQIIDRHKKDKSESGSTDDL